MDTLEMDAFWCRLLAGDSRACMAERARMRDETIGLGWICQGRKGCTVDGTMRELTAVVAEAENVGRPPLTLCPTCSSTKPVTGVRHSALVTSWLGTHNDQVVTLDSQLGK